MTGAFLGISFGPDVSLDPAARRALDRIDSVVGGPTRRIWGEVGPGSVVLSTWERASGLGTTAHLGVDRAWMVCGLPSPDGSPSPRRTSTVGVHSTIVAEHAHLAAWCDDLGYGSIFHWQGSDIAAVSTRPELLVDVASALGDPPRKDPTMAAELTHIGWLGPTRTGWAEIGTLRAGETIRARAGELVVEPDPTATRWNNEPLPARELGGVVATAAEALTGDLRRILDTGEPVFADLTAGRDSRLILAALLELEAHHDVIFQTVGDLVLADVRTAAALASHLGVEHRHGYFYPFAPTDFGERFRAHVATTAGVANVMDGMREVLEPVDHVRLSGLIGEILRGWRTGVSREKRARAVVPGVAGAFGAGGLDILRPAARAIAEDRVRKEILETGHADLPGWHAAHRYYGEVRLRGRMSRVDDFTSPVLVYPLYTPRLAAAGAHAMWHHPDADVATLLIEHLAPGLDDVVLDDAPPPDAPATDASFMKSVLAEQAALRRGVFTATAELDSAAWDSIDHAAYVDAVDRYDELTHRQIRLLHGAAGAVIWLGA